MQFAHEAQISISDAMIRAEESGLSKKYALIAQQFGRLLETFRTLSDNLSVTDLTQTILEESGYQQMLEAEKTVEAETRLENLKEFLSITTAFDNREDSENLTLSAFLAEVALFTDLDQLDEAEDAVTIMTMHGAKGLEFPVVFIAGMEENIFPHARAVHDLTESGMEEERRLCYVAITRAKEQVYFTRAGERMLYGRTAYNPMSRFLREIPAELILDMNREMPRKQSASQRSIENSGVSLSGLSLGITQTKVEDAPVSTDYQINDTIEHKKWGQGVIVGVSGSGEELSVRVIFPEMGMKDLFVKYAPIKKV